jgi:hypothetical protein
MYRALVGMPASLCCWLASYQLVHGLFSAMDAPIRMEVDTTVAVHHHLMIHTSLDMADMKHFTDFTDCRNYSSEWAKGAFHSCLLSLSRAPSTSAPKPVVSAGAAWYYHGQLCVWE